MAFFKKKKEKVKAKNDDDFDDFDDFDFDMDGLDDIENMMNRKPSKREMAKMTAKSAAKKTAKNVGSDVIKEAIPGDFEYNVTEIHELVKETKSILQDAISDTTKSASKLMPKFLREKLGFYDEAKVKAPSQADIRAASMASEMNEIFGGSAPAPKVLTNKDVDEEGTVKGRGTEAAMASLQNRISVGMSNDMARLSGFMTKVGNAYFKKSLELQFKSYYLGLDTIELQSTYFKGFSQQFESIVKNTALPEHVKITNAERFEGYLKQAMLEKTYARAVTNNQALSTFKNNFTKAVKNKASAFKDTINMIVDLKDNTEDNKSMRYEILTDMIGGFLGDKASSKLSGFSSKIASKFKDKDWAKRLGLGAEGLIKNTEAAIDNYRLDVKDRLEKLEDNLEFSGTIKRKFYGGIDSLLKMFKGNARKTDLEGDSIESFGKGAMFDKLTHRTINEGIPMLLSSILREATESNRMFRAAYRSKLDASIGNGGKWEAYKGNSEKVYNIFSRSITDVESYRRDANDKFGKTFNKNDELERVASDIANETITRLKKAEKADKKDTKFLMRGSARSALADYIKTAESDSGITADFDTLFKNVLDPKLGNAKLREMVESNHELKRMVEYIQEAENHKTVGQVNLSTSFENKMSSAKSEVPRTAVKDFYKIILGLGNEDNYNLNDDEADTFGLILMDHLLNNRGKYAGLTKDKKTWEAAFSGDGRKESIASKEAIGRIRVPLTKFFNAFDTITTMGDGMTTRYFASAIENLVTSLRSKTQIGDGVDQVLDVTQQLSNIDRRLVGGMNKININQIVSKNLDVVKVNDAMDMEDFYSISRPNGEVLRKIHDDLFSTSFSKLAGDTDEIGKHLQEIQDQYGKGIGGRLRQAKYLAGLTRDKVTSKYTELRANSDKYTELAKEFSGKLLTMGEDAIYSAVKSIKSRGDTLLIKLQEMRAEEESAFLSEMERLEELKTIDKRTNATDESNVNDTIARVKARHEKRIGMIDKVIKATEEMNTSIGTRLNNVTEGTKVSDLVKSIQGVIDSNLDKFNNLVELSEKAET